MRLTVGPEQEGERLDALLAPHVGSRSRAQRLVRDGRVLVDGAAARKGQRVRGGPVRARVGHQAVSKVLSTPATSPCPGCGVSTTGMDLDVGVFAPIATASSGTSGLVSG